ncbi:MAG: YkvA family protein [Hyphomicrobiaceae bacterium]
MGRLRHWARVIRRDAVALYFAARDPRVPWLAKFLAIMIAAYALSPIDLIPDFIPVLGFIDEVILLPLAIAGVARFIPPAIMDEHRARAEALATRPVSRSAAVVVFAVWIIAATLVARWLFG